MQVKPSLGKPSYPSSVKSGHKFTVSGSVKPGAPTGPAVKVRAYRKNSSGAYASYKTYSTTISGTTYKASIKINKTGKYKFKATTARERAVRRQRDRPQQRSHYSQLSGRTE